MHCFSLFKIRLLQLA